MVAQGYHITVRRVAETSARRSLSGCAVQCHRALRATTHNARTREYVAPQRATVAAVSFRSSHIHAPLVCFAAGAFCFPTKGVDMQQLTYER
jgi:hypothetical protein